MPRPAPPPPPRRSQVQFDLTSLRVFIATAEAGGLTRAAERVALAPAAASRRILDLESQLGVALFERRPHGMALTEAGRTLLAHARHIVRTAARMQDEAASYRQGHKGVVRIAAATSMVLQCLPADLQRCADACPDVRIDLQEMNSQGVLRAMARHAADLGIYEAGVAPAVPWPAVPYRDDRLAVLVPRTHRLAQRTAARLADIAESELIGLDEGSAMMMTLERQASEHGLVLRTRTRVGSYDSMAAMVAEGVGIGVMPASIARQAAQTRPLRCVPIREPWAVRRFMLCMQPDDLLSEAGKAIARLLADSPNANAGSAK